MIVRKKPERLAEKTIELDPVQVEVLKVLLRDVAHTGRVRFITSPSLGGK